MSRILLAAVILLGAVLSTYIASACNVGGLSISASVGRALADLIVDGASQPDLRSMSVERFRGQDLDDAALRAACVHAYARKYTKAQ